MKCSSVMNGLSMTKVRVKRQFSQLCREIVTGCFAELGQNLKVLVKKNLCWLFLKIHSK